PPDLRRPRNPPRHVRHHPDPRLPIPHPSSHPLELPQHRIHERRVKRMRHHQPLPPITPLPQLPKTRLHRLLRTGHHRVLRSVHRRHTHSAPTTLPHLPHLTLRRKHRRHHSTRWQRPHEPTPRSNQPQPILQTEHPRHARRHILPHTVPQHHRRLHPPRAPQLAQRILQRKERRLRVLDRKSVV